VLVCLSYLQRMANPDEQHGGRSPVSPGALRFGVMRKLIEAIPRPVRIGLLVLTAIAGIWLWREMAAAMEPAIAASSSDIVAFEFAGSPERASDILSEWGADGRQGARRALQLDYGFLVAYAIFLTLGSASVAMAALRRDRKQLGRIGWRLAGLALLAGVLDAIENTALLTVVDNYDSGSISAVATATAAVVAGPKFVFVIAAALYVIGAGAYLLVTYNRDK
jgi:hypothetical protein